MSTYTAEQIHNISKRVYRKLLGESAGGSAEFRAGEADRMIEKDGDGGEKFSRRAKQYDNIVRVVLETLDDIEAGRPS